MAWHSCDVFKILHARHCHIHYFEGPSYRAKFLNCINKRYELIRHWIPKFSCAANLKLCFELKDQICVIHVMIASL